MAVLLSFLGTGTYQETTYFLDGKSQQTRFCPAALAAILRPETMLIAMTEAAKAAHYEALALEVQQLTGGATKVAKALLPEHKDEMDLWATFDRITADIPRADRVIIDITHGFRFQPMLGFLAAAFLRTAHRVQIDAIYYGAWEARDTATNISPVFDLTPFLTLLDWTIATDQLLATGDSDSLSKQLEQAHRLPWQRAAAKPRAPATASLPRRLQTVAGILETLGEALRLNRPATATETAAQLLDHLDSVRTEAGTWARPFAALLDQLRTEYEDLALRSDPGSPDYGVAALATQRNLVRWYVKRRQYVQAFTLAREWLVSFAAHKLGWDTLKDREVVEGLLNAATLLARSGRELPLRDTTEQWMAELAPLWASITQARNDLAHCGMSQHPRSAKVLEKAAAQLQDKLSLFEL